MNSAEYYFEFRRKSFEFEHFGNNEDNNLLKDYEFVTNEELNDDVSTTDADLELPKHAFTQSTKIVVEQNQTPTKVNKSITKAEVPDLQLKMAPIILKQSIEEEQQQPQQQQHQIASCDGYTVVPIVVTRGIVPATDGNTVQSKALNTFKKTVLTTRKPTTAAKACGRNHHNNQQQQQQPPPLVPTVTDIIASSNDTVEKTRPPQCTAHDDNNEFLNSQPGSSTSPESYVDHILSAASSVSVRSSSSLSSSTDVAAHFMVSKASPVGSGAVTKKSAPYRPIDSSNNRIFNSTASALHNIQARQNIVAATNADEGAVAALELRKWQRTTLQPPESEPVDTIANYSGNYSPSQRANVASDSTLLVYPEELKCTICGGIFRDPRTLNCLHSFCFQCLVAENFNMDNSIPFWSQPGANEAHWKSSCTSQSVKSSKESSTETTVNNRREEDTITTTLQRRRSSFSFRRKKSLEKPHSKSDSRSTNSSSPAPQERSLPGNGVEKTCKVQCKICNFATKIPIGGLRQLPQNFLLVRKIEQFYLQLSDDVIAKIWCSLCFEETNATYHCISCTLNLCTLCKEAHERQRNTADHHIEYIIELRRARQKQQIVLNGKATFTLQCGMHPGFEIKSFCTQCLQLACADCLILLHKGHKYESITKASTKYSKLVHESTDQIRPLCSFAQHSIERLNNIAKNINQRCDAIRTEVEKFMSQYSEAIEVHRNTLLQQVQRARESKVETILEQQLDLEKRTAEAMEAVRFSQELAESGSNTDLLAFASILLKRFEYCSQFRAPQDPKISEALHFLPHMRAPTTKTQNNIPLFGIITMQTVEPALCTIETSVAAHLRLHRRLELIMQSRDADGAPLCHGGLATKALLKYKEHNAKTLPVEITDNRDGTYGISFVPDAQGTILLTLCIDGKPIKGSPFNFLARTVRPHNGIYHCCAFCSSKGNKLVRCACEGRMPGYNGCGHGHPGHPGRRHWSCCGNVLENSECSFVNRLLN